MRRWLALFVVASACAPVSGDVQAPLTSFETSAAQTADALVSLTEHAGALKVALAANDQAGISAFVDHFTRDLDQLDQGAIALEAAETALQAEPSLGTNSIKQGLGDGSGFMATLRKTFDLRGRYREWNKTMSDARNAQWQAETDVGQGVDGAEARLTAAKQAQRQVGEQVIGDLGANVSTTLVTAPLKPVTLGGKILKAAAGKVYQKGLVVLTSTRACDTDVKAPACVIGVEKTDAQGQIKAPAGTNSLVVSGGGMARVRVDKTEFATPATAIERPLVPISQATAATLTRGDEVDDDGFPVDPVYVPWIICMLRTGNVIDPPVSGSCVKYDGGDINAWDALTDEQRSAWCKARGFTEGPYSYMDEAGCRHTCSLFAASTCTQPCTKFVCSTPGP